MVVQQQQPYHELVYWGLPLLLILSYVFFLLRHASAMWFHVIIWSIFMYLVYAYDLKGKWDGKDAKPAESRNTFVKNILGNVDFQTETNKCALYPTYRKGHPFRFVFLPKYTDLLDVFMQLEPVRRFDLPSYNQALVLTERFLKTHYVIMTSVDPELCEHYFSILKDMRSELLNTMHTMILNMPTYFKRPVHLEKQPFDVFIRQRIRYVQAFTYKKMRIISRKCNHHYTYNLLYKPPYGVRHYEDNRYSLF